MPTWTTGPGPASAWAAASRSSNPSPRWATTVQPCRAAAISSARDAVGQVAGERQHPAGGAGPGGRLEGVQQRGGRDLGGAAVADGRTEAGLGLPGDRCLRDHEHGEGHRDSTFAKSRAVRSVPDTEPETFERVPAARGW